MSTQPAALAVTEAEKLNKRIRTLAHSIDGSWKQLEELIIAAKAREIHTDLGFRSWAEYIAEVARTEMPNIARSVEQRRQVVALLAGEGLSQRAIADAVGVSQKTVDRDLDQLSHDDSPEEADDRTVRTTVVCDLDAPPDSEVTNVRVRFEEQTTGEAVTLSPEEQARINERLRSDKDKIAAQIEARKQPATVTRRDGKQYPAEPKAKPKSPWPKIPNIAMLWSDTLTLERRLDELFVGPKGRRRVASKVKPIDPLRDEFTFSLRDLEAAVEAHEFPGRAVEKMKMIAAVAYASKGQ